MSKVLVVIDMQNDFITGSLANQAAAEILPNVQKLVKEFNGEIIFTRDTHDFSYNRTQEGIKLPILHCQKGTFGHQIHRDLLGWKDATVVDKKTFGSIELLKKLESMCSGFEPVTEIHFCGTVTEICVVSNVLMVKNRFPEHKIVVHKDACAGLSKEGHKAALKVMESCQCEIVI